MNTPDTAFELVELATGNDIVAYFDRANDQAVVFALLPEEDRTVRRARTLIQAFRDLDTDR